VLADGPVGPAARLPVGLTPGLPVDDGGHLPQGSVAGYRTEVMAALATGQVVGHMPGVVLARMLVAEAVPAAEVIHAVPDAQPLRVGEIAAEGRGSHPVTAGQVRLHGIAAHPGVTVHVLQGAALALAAVIGHPDHGQCNLTGAGLGMLGQQLVQVGAHGSYFVTQIMPASSGERRAVHQEE